MRNCKTTSIRSSVITILLLTIGGSWPAEAGSGSQHAHFGKLIGTLNNAQSHGIRGDIYAVDARTLFIKGFSYDGKGRDVLFYAGSSPQTGADGFVIPNEDGSREALSRAYNSQDLTLTLPEGKTLKEIRWITLYNRAFSEHYGEVRIPSGFDYPRPQRLSALSGIHKVSSDKVYVVDAQTFLVPNFTYDGAAPDAFFWVGTGAKPSQNGVKVPDENGKLEILRRYDSKTLVLTLPGDLTVFDIDWLSIWCQAFGIDFGHIRIPKSLNVPPSLKMLGVAPQAKLNCEVLWDDLALEVRWAVAGETIVLQLVGKIDDGQYVAFGPSGDTKKTKMIGADVAVGWLDRATGKGFVHDHYITSKSQCSGGKGVCQDTLAPRGANNIRLLNAALVNDYVMLTYQRPLRAQDDQDKGIVTNGTQAVIWAVGALNPDNEPTYHKLRNKGDLLIDFGRSPFWNCPAPEEPSTTVGYTSPAPIPAPPTTEETRSWPSSESSSHPTPHNSHKNTNLAPIRPPPSSSSGNKPWYIPTIECYEPESHVFYAHIGPTGGSRGYSAITGQPGWGITWFINGLLIPEVTVVRGQTYTFVVEGGQDPERPARYHPFYITDDPEGGYEFKTPAERAGVQVYAGVTYDREGNPAPTAQGRLCEWVEDPSHPADSFTSFGAYQRTLKLHCEEGQPALLQWTVEEDTPDTVYYQCYTHRYLGWKIRVVDSCEDNHNRKAGTVPPPSGNRPQEDDQDYFDDAPPAGKNNHQGKLPSTNNNNNGDNGFFPSNPFGSFDDFTRDQDVISRPSPPLPPTPFNRPVQQQPPPPSRQAVNSQQDPEENSRPLDLLTKLLNQASPLGQQQQTLNQRNPPPPRRQFAIERPAQPQQTPPQAREEDEDDFEEPPNKFLQQQQPPKINPSVQLRRPFIENDPVRSLVQHEPVSFGFNPGTVIMESGFKPIRKSDGPIPPLGFEVEAQPSISHHQDEYSESNLHNHRPAFREEPTSDRPSFITLDPVFVASEPDGVNGGQRGRPRDSAPVQLPKAVVPVVPGPPQLHGGPRFPGNNPPIAPPPQQPPQFRQPQPVQRPLPPLPPQQLDRKKPSVFSSLFGFGGQRRNQQVDQPEYPSSPPRTQQQQQQRRPPASQEYLNNRNSPRPLPPNVRPESTQQRLAGFLQRFLMGETRRKDVSGNGLVLSPTRGHTPAPIPRPIMTFQGPLPPIIAAKVQSASRPASLPGGPSRSDNTKMSNAVLDPYSASIIGGGSLLGLPGTKTGISEADKAQLERFLFGPGEYMAPRSFSSSVLDFLRSEGLLLEDTTDLPVEDFTDVPNNDDNQVKETDSVDLLPNDSPLKEEVLPPSNDHPDGQEELDKVREKRGADRSEDHHQHLDHDGHLQDDVDSSKLPVEHRGLDEDDDLDGHHYVIHNESSRITNSPLASLFIVCLSLIRHFF